jgi:hypothetical protein
MALVLLVTQVVPAVAAAHKIHQPALQLKQEAQVLRDKAQQVVLDLVTLHQAAAVGAVAPVELEAQDPQDQTVGLV